MQVTQSTIVSRDIVRLIKKEWYIFFNLPFNLDGRKTLSKHHEKDSIATLS